MTEPNAIGYIPTENAEVHAGAVAALAPAPADPVAEHYQGGRFVTQSWTPEDARPQLPPRN
jgi:hypothetical protein